MEADLREGGEERRGGEGGAPPREADGGRAAAICVGWLKARETRARGGGG